MLEYQVNDNDHQLCETLYPRAGRHAGLHRGQPRVEPGQSQPLQFLQLSGARELIRNFLPSLVTV
jgi:hypothetical protein